MNQAHLFYWCFQQQVSNIIFCKFFERDIVNIDCVICILFLHNVELYLPAMFYISCVSGIN